MNQNKFRGQECFLLLDGQNRLCCFFVYMLFSVPVCNPKMYEVSLCIAEFLFSIVAFCSGQFKGVSRFDSIYVYKTIIFKSGGWELEKSGLPWEQNFL